MDVRILGPLQVVVDGEELPLGGTKQRAVLAVLIGALGTTVSVDRLIDEVWGEHPPPRVTTSLQAYISRLRRLLEPQRGSREPADVLVTRPPGYALVLAPEQVDAHRFERDAEAVRRSLADGKLESAHARATEALAAWRGDVLADLTDEPVAHLLSPRWHELRLAVEEDRLTAAVGLGLHATAIADLESLLAAHPLRERSLALLMQALHRSGRTVEALDRYRTYREHLADELGVDPGLALRELETALLRHDPILAPDALTISSPGALAASGATSPLAGETVPAPSVTPSAVTPPSVAPPPVTPPPIAPPPVAPPPVAPPLDGDLVGRDEETERLRQAVDGAGAPGWAVVSGEAGIGKTRLIEAVTAYATSIGRRTAWGRCHEDGDAPPYWAWSQILQALEPGADDAFAGLATATDGGDLAARRFQIHELVRQRLADAAGAVIVIDDLQWADAASLQLLTFLAVHATDAPYSLFCTLRSGEAGQELVATLSALARRSGTLRLEVGALDVDDLAELSERLIGERLSPEAAQTLHERTSGNAFFASELLRLRGSGPRAASVGAAPTSTAAAAGGAMDPVPPAVHDVVERRLLPLGEDVRSVLEIAATIGSTFDLDLLGDAGGADEERLTDALDLCLATSIVVAADAPGRFRFAHAIVRDTLLADLTSLRRLRLHARVAEALRSRARADPARQAAQLAHHLAAAVPFVAAGEAREACEVAALAAEGRLAFGDAADWWLRAATLADLEASDAHDQRVAAARASLLGSRTQVGRQLVAEIMDLALARGDGIRAAEAAASLLLGQGIWLWAIPGEDVAALIDRCERTVPLLNDHPTLRAQLLATIAQAIYHRDVGAAATLVEQAVETARGTGDDELLGSVLAAGATVVWPPDGGPSQRAMCEELLALPVAATDPFAQVAGRLLLTATLRDRGEHSSARAQVQAAAEVADRSGSLVLQSQVAWSTTAELSISGDVAALRSAIDEATDLSLRSGLAFHEVNVAVAELSLAWFAGTLHDPPATAVAGLEAMGGYLREFDALVRLAVGDRDGAAAVLGDWGDQPKDWTWLGRAWLRCLVIAEIGDDELAEQMRAALAPYAERWSTAGSGPICFGPVEGSLGLVAETRRSWDDAAAHWASMVRRCDDAGAEMYATFGRLRLASLQARAGHAVGELAGRVHADAGRLGMVGVQRAASALG